MLNRWLGDDDYDLAVVTPLGTTVAVSSVADEASGGVFGEKPLFPLDFLSYCSPT